MKTAGYEALIVYWIATTIYDLNLLFCDTYIARSSRTHDQMVQAARSGKQNIVEASMENSVESNLKLTGVARASYGELIEDYKDFLRTKNLLVWEKTDPKVLEIRKTIDSPYKTYKSYTTYMTNTQAPESYANLVITLCYKQMYLLSKLLQSQQEKFVKEGGFRENLFKKRIEYKKNI